MKMKMEINKRFQEDMKALMKKVEKDFKDKDIKKIAFRLLAMIQKRNPVRLVGGGRSRAGWNVMPISGGWRIFNRVEYTIYLEYGRSRQAPNGMVRVSIQQLASDLRGRK